MATYGWAASVFRAGFARGLFWAMASLKSHTCIQEGRASPGYPRYSSIGETKFKGETKLGAAMFFEICFPRNAFRGAKKYLKQTIPKFLDGHCAFSAIMVEFLDRFFSCGFPAEKSVWP